MQQNTNKYLRLFDILNTYTFNINFANIISVKKNFEKKNT